jgi:mRNA-degrading endonuclease RelE of RelBE toxin-antitoxin system
MSGGHHEKIKDAFNQEFSSWNYAWRGKTLDGRNLRLIFYIEDGLIFVTIIELSKRG